MEARNTKCGPYIHKNDLMYSDTLNGGFTISMYSGKTPSYMECSLNPVNKGKYKRNVLSVSVYFFLYISSGTFFGQGIAPASQRGIK